MSAELSANSLLAGCEVHRGQHAAEKNAASVAQIYDSIKTSYGPLGLDKMCVDASGFVSITNDGATILKNMLVEDPTARMMVNLALDQDKEVGDGTTTVVLLASNLIRHGTQLIKDGVHPSVVVSGYRIAFNESVKFIKNKIANQLTDTNLMTNILNSIILTAISSKIIGQEPEVFTEIVRKALENVRNGEKYNINMTRILKAIGGSLNESEFANGFLLNCTPACRTVKDNIDMPNIICLNFSLNKEKLPITVNIKVNDPEKMEEIRKEEIEITKRKCNAIIKSGANIVLTTGGIDELYTKMFADHGIVAVKRCLKEDLKVLAEATGTELYDSLVNMENSCEIERLGMCQKYELKSIEDSSVMCFSGCGRYSILLRGPNSQILDEAERALNDALQVAKRTLEMRSVVPGGGAVEAALSFLLEEFASEVGCREHIAIHRYSQALLEIPRILAANAGLDADKIVAELLKRQFSQFGAGKKVSYLGIDVMTGEVQDNLEAGIIEPTIYKLKALKAATEAAIGVLRIDEVMIFAESK